MKPATNTLADLWESFAASHLPIEAGETQRSEMQVAFYCGAAATLSSAMNARRLPIQLANVELSAMRAEILEWTKQLAKQEGKA